MPYCVNCESYVSDDVAYIADCNPEKDPFVVFNEVTGEEDFYCQSCSLT